MMLKADSSHNSRVTLPCRASLSDGSTSFISATSRCSCAANSASSTNPSEMASMNVVSFWVYSSINVVWDLSSNQLCRTGESAITKSFEV